MGTNTFVGTQRRILSGSLRIQAITPRNGKKRMKMIVVKKKNQQLSFMRDGGVPLQYVYLSFIYFSFIHQNIMVILFI
jgi:hypothetical protein